MLIHFGQIAKSALALVCLLMFGAGSANASDYSDQPSYLGLTLAYPQEEPERPLARFYPWVQQVVRTVVTVGVDSSGSVTSVEPEAGIDSLLFENVRYLIDELPFCPALWEGRAVESKIPVELIFRPDAKIPLFVFPNGQNLGREDNWLLAEACRLNGIELPELLMFPVYAGANKHEDTALYPRAVIRVDLDTTGQVVGSDVVYSSFADINPLLLSAALWAEFSPATVLGNRSGVTVFLQISLFPAMDYPLKRWRPENWTDMSFHQRASVRLVADTVGLLFRPIPRTDAGDRFGLRAVRPPHWERLVCYAVVDTLGRVRLRPEWQAGGANREMVKVLEQRIKLYPAIDMAGQKQIYRGFITIDVESATNVRISPHWLRAPR